MELVFEITAPDATKAETIAADMIRHAPPALKLSNPEISTQAKRRKDRRVTNRATKVSYRFKVQTPIDDQANQILRRFLQDHLDEDATAVLVSPRFTTNNDLRSVSQMSLSDTLGKSRLAELGIRDRPLALSADETAQEEFRPLRPANGRAADDAQISHERRRELGLRTREPEPSRMGPERRHELGMH